MKKLFALIMTLCLVLSLAACGGGENAAGGDGVVDICVGSEPASIDPALNSSVDGAIMLQHAFEGLVKWVDDGEGNAVLAEGMADSWEVSEDGLVWTFHIREDAKWSDGEPVTSNDFEYSWRRAVSPDTAADYEYMLDMVAGYDEGNLQIECPDANTFVVTLSAPCPYFEEICAFPATFPVRKDIIEANGDQWTFDPATYISNGPFKMTKWEHNAYILFEQNENYYAKDDLTATTLKFHLMDDANAIYAAYKSGELDYIQNFPQDETSNLIASGEVSIADYVGSYYVNFQTQKAPFDNPRIREAFSLVIDRNYIVEQVTGAGEVAADGFVPAGVYDFAGAGSDDFRTVGGAYYSIDSADYEANCEKAREILAEEGYPNGEGFPVVEYLYNTDDKHKAIGEALQHMWQEELGVTVTLQNQEWNVFQTERKKGNYSIARGGWIADYNDPMTFLDMFMTGGGNNDPQYANPEYDKLIKSAKAETDLEKRMQLMHDAEDLLVGTDKVVAPIYFYTQPYMLQSNIQGMYYTPLGYFFFGYTTGM